jgi:hypothetical protein
MNDQQLYEKFEICLNALQLGASVENCLNLFPDDANELLPLLRTVQHAQQAAYDAPRVDVITRSRTKLLREADRLRNKKTANVFGMRIPRVALATTFVLLLLVFGAGGLLATSAKSLPGDQTYPLKLVVENLRVQFAPDPGMRIDLEENINQRRVTEVQHLLDIGRSVPVSFTGKVERMTDGFWIVKDILVNVDETTKISGEISPGDVIEIDGTTSSDGWVNAVDVRLDAGEVDGIISSISETGFSIDGIPFVIDHETQFDPRIIEGDRVIVLIKTNQDDAIIARAVLKISE